MIENPYAILPVENMNSPGIFTCIAECHLGKNKCVIKAMEIEVLQRLNAKVTHVPEIQLIIGIQFIIGLYLI